MTVRHQYMWHAVAGPEDVLCDRNVVLGIIGLSRSHFDTMLRPLPTSSDAKSKGSMLVLFWYLKHVWMKIMSL